MPTTKLSIRKSLVFSFAQRYTSFIFIFASVVIVSRLLTPKEIGIFSVASGLATLANMLRTFGISDYLVQEKNLTEQAVRTSFTINLLFAWTLALVLFIASWLVGDFFADAGLGRVMRVQSGSFVLVPFGVTAMALMKRNMEFGSLYKISTGSSIVGSVLTIALAYAGFSYMSMAWGGLAQMFVMVAGCAVWGRQYRVRGLGLAGWQHILPFGAQMTASDIAAQLGEQSASVVIGKMLGLADAGFYSRGYGAVNIFRERVVDAVGAVAFPAFAAEHREQGTAPNLFLRTVVYLTGVSWPFFAFSALMAFPMIRIMFGDQWDAAIPLMRWLCLAAIVGTLTYQCNHFFVAVGRVGSATAVELQYQIARVAITIAAALWSVEAVAAAQVLVFIIATVLYYRKIADFEALSMNRCVKALLPSGAVTLATCVAPTLILLWPSFLQRHLFLGLIAASAGAGVGWLLAALLVGHPLLQELQSTLAHMRDYLRKLRST
jgi:O-antigen/teichoic acid export membrane protein